MNSKVSDEMEELDNSVVVVVIHPLLPDIVVLLEAVLLGKASLLHRPPHTHAPALRRV